jgi:benzoyl-CoA reductase subunit C
VSFYNKEGKRLETRIKSKAFQKIAEASEAITNPEIEKWKDQGKKVLGYFCSALPGELVTAAGMLPVRLRATGSTSTELSDSFFSNLNCSFPRHAFNAALKGDFDFADGVILFNSCDHIRRIYDHWTRQLDTSFIKILSLPKKAEQPQVEWFRTELAEFMKEMEAHFGVTFPDDKLREAIKLHNESRRLMRKIYDLRKSDNPPITGAEMLAITVASTAMPQNVFIDLLKELLDELGTAKGNGDHRARILLMGGELDNPEYVKAIENQGALVVSDTLCFGSRMLWKDVNEEIDDPLTALAQYYIVDRPSCARVFTEYPSRLKYIKSMLKDFNVDGAIFSRLTFCEMYGFEQFSLSNDFKTLDVPLLCLDREYTLSGVGQLKTRVQAFLETMGR